MKFAHWRRCAVARIWAVREASLGQGCCDQNWTDTAVLTPGVVLGESTGWPCRYQYVQYRTPPAADLATYNAALQSGALTLAQAQANIIGDLYTLNTVNPVIREYQAAFGRVPDQAGASFWVNALANGTQSLATLGTTFANSAEFTARFGATATTLANSALVEALYTNVYGRAPDAAGLAFWAGSGLTAAQLLNAFANSAEFTTLTGPAVIAFQQLEIAGTPPTSGSLFALGGNVGGTFNLTTAADTLVGGSSIDTFNGVFDNGGVGANNSTLNSSDNLSGGAAVDTLNVRVVNTAGGGVVAPLTTGIENISIQDITGGAAFNLNGATMTGVTKVSFDGSTLGSDSNVTALNNNVTVGFTNTVVDPAVNFKAGLFTGTADKVSVTGTAAGTTLTSIIPENAVTLNLTGGAGELVEALDITTTGAGSSNFTVANAGLTANSLTSVTVNAGQATKVLLAGQTKITTFDATTSTAGVTADVSAVNAQTSLSVKGGAGGDNLTVNLASANAVTADAGAGNDTVTLSAGVAAALTTADKVDGGAGTDTLSVSSADAAFLAGSALVSQVTNFETLRVGALTNSFDISKINAINTLQVNGAVTSNTVSGFTSGATIEDRSAAAVADPNLVNNVLTVTIPGATAANTPNDTLNVRFNADLFNGGTAPSMNLSVAGVNVLNVSTADRDNADSKSDGTAAKSGYTLGVLNGQEVTSVKVTGDQALTLSPGANFNSAVTIDAAAFTGELTVNLANSAGTQGATVTGGSKNDTVTGTALADAITGGAGDDVINGGAGEAQGTGGDTLTGGDGRDTFVLSTSGFGVNQNVTAGVDTLKDFVLGASGDRLSLINVNGPTAADLGGAANAQLVIGSNVGINNDPTLGRAEVLVLDSTVASLQFANAQALDAVTFTLANAVAGQILVVYSSSATGDARLATATLTGGGDIANVTDIAVLSGTTTAAFATGFNGANIGAFSPGNVTFTANKVAFNTANTGDSQEGVRTGNGIDTINATGAQIVGATIDGGLSADTLNVSGPGNTAIDLRTPASLTSVETINITGGTTAAVNLMNSNQTVNGTGGGAFTDVRFGNVAGQTYNASANGDTATFGAAGQTFNGGVGADTAVLGSALFASGTVNGGAGIDTLKVGVSADISAMTLNSVETLDFNNAAVTVTMKVAQYTGFTTGVANAAGAQTVTFSDAMAINATAVNPVENYNILGGGAGTFFAGAATNVTVAGGAAIVDVAQNVNSTGTHNVAGTGSTLVIGNGTTNISGINGGAATGYATLIDRAGAGSTTTNITQAQHNGFTTINLAGAADVLTFTDAVTAGTTGNATVETYNLGNFANNFTVVASQNVTGNANDDVVNLNNVNLGAVAINGGAQAAADTLNINTGTNTTSATISNFENVNLNGTVTLSAAQLTTFLGLGNANFVGNNSTVNVGNAASGLALTNVVANFGEIAQYNLGNFTNSVTFTEAAVAANLNLKVGTGTDTVTINNTAITDGATGSVVITSFTNGAGGDVLKFQSNAVAQNGGFTTINSGTPGAVGGFVTGVIEVEGGTLGTLTDITAVKNFLGGAVTTTVAGDSFFIIYNNAGTTAGIYHATTTAAADAAAANFTAVELVGTVNTTSAGSLVAANFA